MDKELINLPDLIENAIKYYLDKFDIVTKVDGDVYNGYIQTARVKIEWDYKIAHDCCDVVSSVGHSQPVNEQTKLDDFIGISTNFRWIQIRKDKYLGDTWCYGASQTRRIRSNGTAAGQRDSEYYVYKYILQLSDEHWIEFWNIRPKGASNQKSDLCIKITPTNTRKQKVYTYSF